MPDHPYTVLSCGMSIDGYVDSVKEKRLALSNAADFDRVDAVRASSDAILVGAATVRNDNPRLLIRSAARRRRRVELGLRPAPMKITVTASGKLDACADFFAAGDADKIVYCPTDRVSELRYRIGDAAEVVDGGWQVQMRWVAEDLHARGVRRLMVEGGGIVHTQFLTADLADELQLVVAPMFIGDSRSRRFVGDGQFPWNPRHRARLAESRQIGDVVLLRYALSDRFDGS